MSRLSRRGTNKVSAYLEDEVLKALDTYCARTGKSKSMVVNDVLKNVLIQRHDEGSKTAVEEQLDVLHETVASQVGSLRAAVRMLQEMLGLYVRTYLNHTPELDTTHRGEANLSGKRRFDRYLSIVNQSMEPGRSILEQPFETHQENDHD